MDVIIGPLFSVINILLTSYMWVLIAAVIMSWLFAFGVVNTHNQVVATISEALFRLTEPALSPIRRRLPNLGGLDISPVILILAIYFLQGVMSKLYVALFGMGA